jgi:hypothetical protein
LVIAARQGLRRWLVTLSLAIGAVGHGVACGGDARGFVALDAGTRSVFVGESFVVTVRCGLEPSLVRDRLVPMFQRAADVPVRVIASDLSSAASSASSERLTIRRLVPSGESATIGCNDDVVPAARRGVRIVDGLPYLVLEVPFAVIAREPGALTWTAPRLEFASATRFEEDLFRGRTPVDRVETAIDGASEVVQVKPLPTAGVPDTFCGAIGRFSWSATTTARDVAVGDELVLSGTLSGEGNLADVVPPDARKLSGFHVRGVLVRDEVDGRRFDWTLVATDADVREIPPLRCAWFDPADGGRYVEAATAPLPLIVRPHASGATRLDLEAPGVADDAGEFVDEVSAEAGDGSSFGTPWVVGVLVAMVLALVWRTLGHRGGADAGAAPSTRSDGTHASGSRPGGRASPAVRLRVEPPVAIDRGAELARCEAALDRDAERAVVAWLAARLAVPAPSVHGPDLASKLRARGVPDELAVRVGDWLARCVAARYGGPAVPAAAGEARAWLAALDDALGERESN